MAANDDFERYIDGLLESIKLGLSTDPGGGILNTSAYDGLVRRSDVFDRVASEMKAKLREVEREAKLQTHEGYHQLFIALEDNAIRPAFRVFAGELKEHSEKAIAELQSPAGEKRSQPE